MTRVAIVVNPRAAAGRTGQRLDELRRLAAGVFGPVELRETRAPGDGARQAREAVDGGAELVIAVGGDGTVNEVVNGLVGATRDAELAIVPAGTGSDLVRTLRVPAAWPDAFAALAGGRTARVDLFDVRCVGHDGAPRHVVGINVVGVGMAGDVVARANRSSKRLGGTVTFLTATLSSLVGWPFPTVTLSWEDEHGVQDGWTGRLTNVFLGNASYCGGGMYVAPRADMSDGLFDLVVIPQQGLPRLAAQTPRLYTGSIAEVRGVITRRVRSLRATSPGDVPVPVDVDGEAPGRIPLEVGCLPGKLAVRLPVG